MKLIKKLDTQSAQSFIRCSGCGLRHPEMLGTGPWTRALGVPSSSGNERARPPWNPGELHVKCIVFPRGSWGSFAGGVEGSVAISGRIVGVNFNVGNGIRKRSRRRLMKGGSQRFPHLHSVLPVIPSVPAKFLSINSQGLETSGASCCVDSIASWEAGLPGTAYDRA